MKFLKFLIVILLVFAVIGYGIYYAGTNIASEKIADRAVAELESTGQIETVKSYVENDPQLAGYIEEAKAADEESLPFATTGEASRVLIQKVGLTEMNRIKTSVENGTMSPVDVIETLETKLTDDELLALKVVAYKELYTNE
ncbi:hypothetical protein [Planomicrobium sp. CPCC 101110]|uniref:hypothetical protein n=1 Tax=Planomicrobium sp. CPCC 101110 TaxID=2599619 RepID=UPI0011B3EE35|nr:hypothetical protein [Planomicrobium sp. CPCC 101110]TWT28240.1 hypothetical protein FQV30_06990 [Planomicrobium sp. CPCC 101110]